MEAIINILTAITDNWGTYSAIVIPIIMVIMRVIPSDKIRCPLSLAGTMIKKFGELFYVLSDFIGRILPEDKPSPEEE